MKLPSEIRAITFDVGGTLIEPWPSVGHVYAAVAAEHGLGKFDPDEITARFFRAWGRKQQFNYTQADWAGLVRDSFDQTLPVSPQSPFFQTLYSRFEQAGAWRVFEDVRPALRNLSSRGLVLGVVSNWDERLRPLLANLKLQPWFRVTVVSTEVGAHKPAREIFEAAARQLGFPPEQILHVGDSSQEDVLGAERAGWQGLLIDRGGRAGQGKISALTEL